MRIVGLVSVCGFVRGRNPLLCGWIRQNGSGRWRPIWAFFGYDEPNYTYMKDGSRLLTELPAQPGPVLRPHTQPADDG